MDYFENQFYNPETELDNKYSNEVHLHRISRNARKCTVVVQGLIFDKVEKSKEFMVEVSKKFGISGCHKMMDDYDKKNKVYVFSGDKRDEIVEILVSKYGYDSDFIKYHG